MMLSMLTLKVNNRSMLTTQESKIAYMKTIGDRIKQARTANEKMTQAELAKLCGVSRSAVTQWESGQSKTLKPENLLCVADKTGFSIRWLITGKGEERQHSVKLVPTAASKSKTINSLVHQLAEEILLAEPEIQQAIQALLFRYQSDKASGKEIANAIKTLLGVK